ncbi:hypothetical protein Tco_0199113 [Tanacetum coccineum]
MTHQKKVIHESSSTSDLETNESEHRRRLLLKVTKISQTTEADQEKSKVREESDSTIPDPSHQTVTSTPPVIAPFTDLRVARLEQEMSDVRRNGSLADEKSKVRKESDSTIPDPSHQTVTSTPPVIAPFTDVSSTKPSLLVTPSPINTEATTITTSLPEITSFIALQLRVARLEQEMSEVKKTDHSADVLERHTADLIEKYSVLPGPESIQNQESEKSPKEIIRTKKEQADEDAMDKEVADKVKDHKRKHDSDDEDDISMQDEGHVSDMEDTDNAHIPKVSTTTWFKPIPEGERSATPEPEWTIPPNDFPEPENNWANTYATTYKESKKMSKRQPGTGGSNEGTGNILGVPDESTVVSRASSEGTGSKPGVPDEEKLILEWEADVVSEHFDRDDNAGDDNEETKPDPEEIYKTYAYLKILDNISSGLVQISVSPTPYVPPSKKDYEILWFTPSQKIPLIQDEQSSSTSPTNQEIHSRPMPQFMAPDHSSSGPVLHEMTSDQIRSDLTPNRQETSVDNISSDLVYFTSSTDHKSGNSSTNHSARQAMLEDGTVSKNHLLRVARLEAVGFSLSYAAHKSFPSTDGSLKREFLKWSKLEGGEGTQLRGFRQVCTSNVDEGTQLNVYGFKLQQNTVYYDSQSAIAISCKDVTTLYLKHIHTRPFREDKCLIRRENSVLSCYFHGALFLNHIGEVILFYGIQQLRYQGTIKDGDGDTVFNKFQVHNRVLFSNDSFEDIMKAHYWTDANLHVHVEEIKVDKTLCFAEEPVEIIDREVKSLKRSRIPIVKSIGT